MMPMTKNENPWADMPDQTQRRINSKVEHELFWVTTFEGEYGLFLQSNSLFKNIDSPANLKDIRIIKRNADNKYGELYLILNNHEDWPIFYTLCQNLSSVAYQYTDDKAMISAVEIRLKRWQQLLKQDKNQEMSQQKQMGLFTELLCLRDIVLPQYGVEQAIVSWVGADFDKQDFLLEDAIFEVKSYKTSKGQTVHISSIKQLISDKIFLYLLTYGLTISENGLSIVDIVQDISSQLIDKSNEIKDEFSFKLLEVGYFPEAVKKPFLKFIVDKNRAFKVTDGFPKILPKNIENGIIDVKYAIDLLACSEYEVNVNSIL
jgi:hypothetical protein